MDPEGSKQLPGIGLGRLSAPTGTVLFLLVLLEHPIRLVQFYIVLVVQYGTVL